MYEDVKIAVTLMLLTGFTCGREVEAVVAES